MVISWSSVLLMGSAVGSAGHDSARAVSVAELDPKPSTNARWATVNTTCGLVEGVVSDDGIGQWVGIPYAHPPVGTLRWQPPQPLYPDSGCWKGV